MGRDHDSDGINRREFVQRSAGFLGAGLAVDGFSDSAAAAGSENPLAGPRQEANVRKDVEKPTAVRTFPVFDGDGNRVGERRWRTVKDTGNCCENYLATAPDGRLFDMGGDYLRVSPDAGQTWHEVEPPKQPYPVATSEGAVTAAPNGDIVAMDWNPYLADRVISYKYEAETETWYYTEVPLKTPFYDRPWLVVIPGPFTIAGTTIPYLTVMRGGYPSDQELYVSFDGLNYVYADTRFVDSLVQGEVETYLDPSENPILDWVQPHTETFIAPLGDGKAIGDGTVASAEASFAEAGCDVTALGVGDGPGPTEGFQWSCFDTPRGFELDRTQVDSRGWIHQVEFLTPGEIEYRVSQDGGKTWTRHHQQLPGEYELAEGLALFDFTVHGGLGKTAIAVHAVDKSGSETESGAAEPVKEVAPEPAKEGIEEAERRVPGREDPDQADDQDMVFVFEDVASDTPGVEIKLVGSPDLSYISGVSTSERFDFATLGILPDGRIAMSFADMADSNPMVAIEAPNADPAYFFEPEGSRTDDGSAFTGGQTDRIDLSVTPVLIPDADESYPVRDRVPTDWKVLKKYSPDVDRVETVDGTKYVYFESDAAANEEFTATYFVEAPDSPDKSGTDTFGPVQVRRDGSWVDVAGTTDTNAVVGQGT